MLVDPLSLGQAQEVLATLTSLRLTRANHVVRDQMWTRLPQTHQRIHGGPRRSWNKMQRGKGHWFWIMGPEKTSWGEMSEGNPEEQRASPLCYPRVYFACTTSSFTPVTFCALNKSKALASFHVKPGCRREAETRPRGKRDGHKGIAAEYNLYRQDLIKKSASYMSKDFLHYLQWRWL